MSLDDLRIGMRVRLRTDHSDMTGRITDIVHVDRPAATVIHVWPDGDMGSSLTIPSGSEHLVSIEEVE